MPATGFVRNFEPLKIMTEEQEDAIHRGTLDVLETTGVRFENQRALELFAKNGCKVDFEERRVQIPPGLVEQSLRQCPSSFQLRARKPENNLRVGGNTLYWAVFPGMRGIDIDTWEPKTPTVEENHDAIKILDTLENVHLAPSYTPYCELEDVPPVMLLPTSCWSQMKYFAKPVRIGQASDSHIWGIEMAQVLDVDVIGAMESAPPLTWYTDAIDCAWACAEKGYPVEVGCGAVLGGTGPATYAGGMVASNAEVMSGIVLVQLVNPGNPILSNAFVFPQNMRTGAPGFGRIGVSLFQVMYNQMWRGRYDIPTMFGGSGMGNSKKIDYQLGYEKSIATVLDGNIRRQHHQLRWGRHRRTQLPPRTVGHRQRRGRHDWPLPGRCRGQRRDPGHRLDRAHWADSRLLSGRTAHSRMVEAGTVCAPSIRPVGLR